MDVYHPADKVFIERLKNIVVCHVGDDVIIHISIDVRALDILVGRVQKPLKVNSNKN